MGLETKEGRKNLARAISAAASLAALGAVAAEGYVVAVMLSVPVILGEGFIMIDSAHVPPSDGATQTRGQERKYVSPGNGTVH